MLTFFISTYFYVISENKDFTFKPNIYFNNDVMLQNEYRQANKNSNHITDFSLAKIGNATKSHFFSNTIMNLESNFFENSDIELNFEQTSNDTYLKNNKITSSINNSSSIYVKKHQISMEKIIFKSFYRLKFK